MARLVSDAPLISVMIPSYNYLRYITMAIDSVRAQTYPNVEILVSDNRSTDGTVAALRGRYADDPRVRIDENETNVGMIGNFNAAYARASGAFLLWLSADDWILPDHLSRLAAVFASEPGLDVVYSGALFADAEGRIFGFRRQPGQFIVDYVDARDELVEMLTTTCPLCWPTALFRRRLFDELGTFDVDGPLASDWEMQVRFAIAGKRFAYLAAPSAVVRMHDAQITGTDYHAAGGHVLDFVAIIERYFDHPGMARMRGRELGITRFIDYLVNSTERAGGSLGSDDRRRIFDLQTALAGRAAMFEPARALEWRVSAIVVAQGPVQLVLRAIASLHEQTFANVEIVVVDQDEVPLEHVLRASAAWPRISYVRLPVPLTLGAARNIGARMARGELLAYVDSDAVLRSDHFESLIDVMANTGHEAVAASSLLVLDEIVTHGSAIRTHATADGVFRGPKDPSSIGSIANALPLGALLMYRRLRETAGPFNEQAPVLEDFEYLLRVERTTKIGFSNRTTFEAHQALGLTGSALAPQLANYVPMLDRIYEAYPATSLSDERVRHRSAVESAIQDAQGRIGSLQGLADLAGTLAGRRVIGSPAS